MSTCIMELYDYEFIEKYSKCEKMSLKTNFHEDKTKMDGLNSNCRVYRKQ